MATPLTCPIMIVNNIIEHAGAGPERPALIEDDVTVSYGKLAKMIGKLASHLRKEELPIDAFAAVGADSFLQQWLITLALRALGLNTFSVGDLQMLKDLRIKNVVCIAMSDEFAARSSLDTGGPNVIRIPPGLLDPEADDGRSDPAFKCDVHGGFVIWTSGTTGHYKKVFFSGARANTAADWYVTAQGYHKDTVLNVFTFPLWTLVGAIAAAVWTAGGCLVTQRKSDFSTYFRHAPTIGTLAPAMLPALVSMHPASAPPQEKFVLKVVGGFLPLEIANAVSRSIGCGIEVIYGASEAVALMRSAFETAEDLLWHREHMSRYEIVDEAGKICPSGVEGEIRVPLGDLDCRGYLDDLEGTAKFFRDGCFYSGDLGVRRDDGRIRILGRVDDVVNLRGFKVPVAPFEEEIGRRVGARAVCLFGERDGAGAEQIVVALEMDRLPREVEIRRVFAGRPGFERFRIVVLKTFPRTEAGMQKINRRALRTMLD